MILFFYQLLKIILAHSFTRFRVNLFEFKKHFFSQVKDYNVLFIDNPVGTGFSYVTSPKGYATTNAVIAHDLVECIKGFLKELPGFANVPTYITTESYGGKMGAEFALEWYKVIIMLVHSIINFTDC